MQLRNNESCVPGNPCPTVGRCQWGSCGDRWCDTPRQRLLHYSQYCIGRNFADSPKGLPSRMCMYFTTPRELSRDIVPAPPARARPSMPAPARASSRGIRAPIRLTRIEPRIKCGPQRPPNTRTPTRLASVASISPVTRKRRPLSRRSLTQFLRPETRVAVTINQPKNSHCYIYRPIFSLQLRQIRTFPRRHAKLVFKKVMTGGHTYVVIATKRCYI